MTAKRKTAIAVGIVLLLSLAFGIALILRGGGDFYSLNTDPSTAVEGSWNNYVKQPQGSGASDDPYRVTCGEELVWLNNNNSGNYYYVSIENDIDLSYHYWVPISLIGIELDGHGNSIKGMFISTMMNTSSQRSNIALFSGTDNYSHIYNLNVYGEINCSAGYSPKLVGGVVGQAWRLTAVNVNSYVDINVDKSISCVVGGVTAQGFCSSFAKCSNYGNIYAPNSTVGGILGDNLNASGADTLSINNSLNYGDIFGYRNIGGIAGNMNNGHHSGNFTIKDCVNYGNVTSSDSNNSFGHTGGIVGFMIGVQPIQNCTNYGEVFSKAGQVGGIAGEANSVKNCKNFGNITGSDNVGGIAGFGPNIVNCIAECNITLNYSTYKNAGGLVGSLARDTFETIEMSNSYFRGNVFCYNSTTTNVKDAFAGIVGGQISIYTNSNYAVNVQNCFADYQINYVGGKTISSVGAIANASYGGTYNLDSCYQDVRLVTLNEGNISKKEYSSGDFSGWDFLEGFNYNLPMQKELFAIASCIEPPHTGSEVIAYLQKKNFKLA